MTWSLVKLSQEEFNEFKKRILAKSSQGHILDKGTIKKSEADFLFTLRESSAHGDLGLVCFIIQPNFEKRYYAYIDNERWGNLEAEDLMRIVTAPNFPANVKKSETPPVDAKQASTSAQVVSSSITSNTNTELTTTQQTNKPKYVILVTVLVLIPINTGLYVGAKALLGTDLATASAMVAKVGMSNSTTYISNKLAEKIMQPVGNLNVGTTLGISMNGALLLILVYLAYRHYRQKQSVSNTPSLTDVKQRTSSVGNSS